MGRRTEHRWNGFLIALAICASLLHGAAFAGPQGASGSTGCGTSPAIAAGETAVVTLDVGGLEREYRLHVPATYDPGVPTPLVLAIHGYGGTAERLENQYTSFSRHADANGYLVAYPQATGFRAGGSLVTSWNDLSCNASPGHDGPICTADAFDYPTPPECGAASECDWCSCHDDVGFIEALLDRVEADTCVDLDRVYATGISNGGMFVQRLGCSLSGRLAAIAPVAGTLAQGFVCAPVSALAVIDSTVATDQTRTEVRGAKTSILNIWGTRDRVVPADGTPASDGFLYTSSEQTLAAWAGSQQCSQASTPYATSKDGQRGLRCLRNADCATGAEVVECSWNGGHDWPRQGQEEFGIDVIWEFFARNHR
jgi:polyhydroxybutyrate depolymerase